MRRSCIAIMLIMCLVSCGGTSNRESVSPIDLTGPLPLVTFVFDDGYDTDYLVALNIFAEQGAVACSAITTDWINSPGYLSPDQIIGLRDAGWEIMSHTVTHPNLRSLGPAQIEDELSRSKIALEGLGLEVNNLVYPYNKSNEKVKKIAHAYYRSGRGGKNELNQGVSDLYDLRSVSNRTHDLGEMKDFIDRAHAEKNWLIIYHHQIDAKSTLTEKNGNFIRGEPLLFSPSGARGRYRRGTWFLTSGSLHYVPLAGFSKPGDTVVGGKSGATARIHHAVYDQRTDIAELVRYVHSRYPDLRIVTIDQGLDMLGAPK